MKKIRVYLIFADLMTSSLPRMLYKVSEANSTIRDYIGSLYEQIKMEDTILSRTSHFQRVM